MTHCGPANNNRMGSTAEKEHSVLEVRALVSSAPVELSCPGIITTTGHVPAGQDLKGAQAILAKPFRSRQILQTVCQVLDR